MDCQQGLICMQNVNSSFVQNRSATHVLTDKFKTKNSNIIGIQTSYMVGSMVTIIPCIFLCITTKRETGSMVTIIPYIFLCITTKNKIVVTKCLQYIQYKYRVISSKSRYLIGFSLLVRVYAVLPRVHGGADINKNQYKTLHNVGSPYYLWSKVLIPYSNPRHSIVV